MKPLGKPLHKSREKPRKLRKRCELTQIKRKGVENDPSFKQSLCARTLTWGLSSPSPRINVKKTDLVQVNTR